MANLAGTAARVSVWVIGVYTQEHRTVQLHRALSYLNPWVAAAALVALGTTLYLLFRPSTSDGEVLHNSAKALVTSDREMSVEGERERPDHKGDSS
jgi:hypothetical protein